MAVYTDVGEGELVDFLADYDLGQVLSFKGIAEGVENSNFLLRTTGGIFILTLYEKRVERGDLPFFLALMQHLAEHGLSCPLPVRRRDGETLGELAGRPGAIFTFLEGIGARRPAPAHCRAVGSAMARLHVIGQGFSMRRENALAIDAWRPLYLSCPDRIDAVEPGLSREIADELDRLDAEWPRGLPSGVIHADLFTDNVFFLGGDLSGIIDFYFACNDTLAYDVAITLSAWCFEADGSFNLTKGTALLKGYQSVRPLTREEAEALPVLCRGAAMRFLLTRLYDWLTVPDGSFVVKKDPREYLRKLRFHRAIEQAGEYGYQSTGETI